VEIARHTALNTGFIGIFQSLHWQLNSELQGNSIRTILKTIAPNFCANQVSEEAIVPCKSPPYWGSTIDQTRMTVDDAYLLYQVLPGTDLIRIRPDAIWRTLCDGYTIEWRLF
jgi:hypothetical protein